MNGRPSGSASCFSPFPGEFRRLGAGELVAEFKTFPPLVQMLVSLQSRRTIKDSGRV